MEEAIKAKKETSASNDESKISEMGYFYLTQQFNSLMQAKSDMRRELKADISGLRSEINSLRTEAKTEINDLRTEIYNVRQELKGDIQAVSGNLQSLSKEINNLRLWVASSVMGILAIIATILGYFIVKG